MEKITNQEWKNQTPEYSEAVAKFVANFYAGKFEDRNYHTIDDLHFSGSGGDSGIMDMLKQGNAPIIAVNTFGVADAIEQIQVVFGTNNGNNIDVYFKGKALADLLKFKAKSEEK